MEQTIEEITQANYVIISSKLTAVSTLGAIPQHNSTDIRLIHDCSRPHRKAVNDYITTRSFKFNAVTLLQPN